MQKRPNLAEAALLLLPFLVIALVWSRLPDAIPMHWDVHGQIDRWSSKPFVFLLPLVTIAVNGLLHALPVFDPKLRRNPHAFSAVALHRFRLVMAALFALLCILQVAAAMRYPGATGRTFTTAVLLLLAFVGNSLGNLRPNYFAGIRTPWTLESADTWRATHRLGGKLMFFGALALIMLQFIVSAALFGPLMLLATAGLVVWTLLYSWRHFQAHAAHH
jgi:uncharacterized membrane protein